MLRPSRPLGREAASTNVTPFVAAEGPPFVPLVGVRMPTRRNSAAGDIPVFTLFLLGCLASFILRFQTLLAFKRVWEVALTDKRIIQDIKLVR